MTPAVMVGASRINRTIVAIITATFFSDVSHQIAATVLPLYLANIGPFQASLGITEGVADFLFSVSKLFGGILGHHTDIGSGLGLLSPAFPSLAVNLGNATTSIPFRRKGKPTHFDVLETRGTLHILRQPSPWSLTAGVRERIKE
jgi:hypothetical protein